MADTITSELVLGRNYFDVVLTSGDGVVSKVIQGTAIVNPTVSE